ncbi:hypothetical protein AHAS_Ahas04G0153100 [Arachis hypogaea]
MGLVHRNQDRLKQLENELERQHESEQALRREGKRSRADQEEMPLEGKDLFTEEIMRAKVLRNFKSLDMELYVGTIDLRHHLINFKSRMYLADASDATAARLS